MDENKIIDKVTETLDKYSLSLKGSRIMSGNIQVGYWCGRFKGGIEHNILGIFTMEVYSGIEEARQ